MPDEQGHEQRVPARDKWELLFGFVERVGAPVSIIFAILYLLDKRAAVTAQLTTELIRNCSGK